MSQLSTADNIRGRTTQLQLCQQNTNKLLVAQSKFLHQLDPNAYDIVALQEPYLDHNHNMCANPYWYTVYPKEHYMTPEKTRSTIFINKQIATDLWFQVYFSSSDITAVQVQTVAGRVLIINIYNNITHAGSIDHLFQTMWARARVRRDLVGT